jgi:hypothetical protein
MRFACIGNMLLALLAFVLMIPAEKGLAFENAKVLPPGVSRMNLRVVSVNLNEKTDSAGVGRNIEEPLEKSLSFRDVLNGEKEALKRELTAGFLLSNGIKESDSLGKFTADLSGIVTVYAPNYSYGITDRVTVAAAIPVYYASMNVDVGFRSNGGANSFRDLLSAGYNNQAEGARDFVSKINSAVDRLNNKLVDNGYDRLDRWSNTGLGDAQLLAKYAIVAQAPVLVAAQGGVVMPTGVVDDPDNLIDIPFGDGQWDGFAQLSLDQPMGRTGFYVNQYAKYTVQFEGRRSVRLKTAAETIEVPKRNSSFDLGDKLNAGAAVLYEGDSGLTSGVGYNFYHKGADSYPGIDKAAQSELEKDTFQRSHEAEFSLGYSAVPAFRRKSVAVPFELALTYKRQLVSLNMPVSHFVQFETGVFF